MRRQRGSAAMMLVLWSFVAVFYFLFAPQIAAGAKAYDALAADEAAYLDLLASRLEQHYRRNAATIDASPSYPMAPAALWADLGIEPKATLQLGISERLPGSQVRFRRFVVWLKRADPDSSNFSASTGNFLPGAGVAYRIVDGEGIQGAILDETLRRMKAFAFQLEQRFRAKFEGDPLRSLDVNHFRPVGTSCTGGTDDIPCIDVHTDVALAADFAALLSTEPVRLASGWGQRFTVSNLEDSRSNSPPYSMAIRAALPWGGSLLVNAVQPLN